MNDATAARLNLGTALTVASIANRAGVFVAYGGSIVSVGSPVSSTVIHLDVVPWVVQGRFSSN